MIAESILIPFAVSLEQKKLTIGAGFVRSDGVVLCANTQEVIPGYTKNTTEKINLSFQGRQSAGEGGSLRCSYGPCSVAVAVCEAAGRDCGTESTFD